MNRAMSITYSNINKNIKVSDCLTINLIPKVKDATRAQAPVISAIEVIRQNK